MHDVANGLLQVADHRRGTNYRDPKMDGLTCPDHIRAVSTGRSRIRACVPNKNQGPKRLGEVLIDTGWKAMHRLLLIITSLYSLALTPAVQAATLAHANGQVLVNLGAGFHIASTSQTLPLGAQVMVQSQGQARILYSKSCLIEVKPGQVHIVSAQPPCEVNASSALPANRWGDPSEYAVVGAGIAAGGGLIYFATQASKSASP